MDFKTHISSSIVTGGLLIFFYYLFETLDSSFLDLIIWVVLFSTIPTLDKNRSIFSHSLFSSLLIASLSLAPILLLYLRFNLSLKFSYLLFTLAWISSLNHVLLDSLTRGGVPLFYPLSKRKHSHFPLIGGRLRLPNSYTSRRLQILALLIFLLFVSLDFLTERESVVLRFLKILLKTI